MVTGTLALDGCNVTSGTAMRGGYVVLEARHWPRDAPRPNFYGLGLKGPGFGVETPRGQIFMALISKSRPWPWDTPRPNFYGLGLKGPGLGLETPRCQIFMALISKVQALAVRRPEATFLWPWSQRCRPWPWDASRPNFYGLGLKGPGLGLETPRGQIFMALV